MKQLSVLVVTLICILLVAGCGSGSGTIKAAGQTYTPAEYRQEIKNDLDSGSVDELTSLGLLSTESDETGNPTVAGYEKAVNMMLNMNDSGLVKTANEFAKSKQATGQ